MLIFIFLLWSNVYENLSISILTVKDISS